MRLLRRDFDAMHLNPPRNDSQRRGIGFMSRKRVILANGPRLLREMLQHVLNKADHLEVVRNLPDLEELPSEIERLAPEWVILPVAYNRVGYSRINSCLADYPSVRFIFLSPESNRVKMKWQTSYDEDLTDLSLKDLLDLLERDLQQI
jgi:hypothetical protein